MNDTTNFFKKIKMHHLSIPESIASDLRSKIMIGNLKGGDQLKQDYLAQQYGVSVSALREALKILEGEDLVSFLPNRGALITKLSAEEALNIFDIRIMLETGALGLAIPKLTDDHLKRAKALLDEEAHCDDPIQYNRINSEFHELLYEASDNVQLLDIIRTLHNNVGRYLVFYLDKMQFKEQSHREHKEILKACKEKDTTGAKRLLKQHMQHAGKCLADYLKMHEE